jgi:hypothetical protein
VTPNQNLIAFDEAMAARSNGADTESHWPAWVEKLAAWSPPADLATRTVLVEFAVDGWIQVGKVGALIAAGGTGKTTLLLHLGTCIALGQPFFGRVVRQGTFVLLSSDDSQADLDGALTLVVQAMRLTPAEADRVAAKVRVFSLQGLDGSKTFSVPISGVPTATGLEGYVLRAVAGISDLVGMSLDTLRQFSGGSSNDEQVIKLAIAGANEIALATDAFVILPHHTGKQSFRDSITDLYCGSGSAAIADNSRFVLLLQKATWDEVADKVKRTGHERGEPLVLTSTRGSLLVRPPPPLFLARDGFAIEAIAGAVLTRDQQADQHDLDILAAVREGCQTKRAILARVGGKTTVQSARIDSLEDRGFLTNVSPNVSLTRPLFAVSQKGAKWLDWET